MIEKVVVSLIGYLCGFLFSIWAFGKTEGDEGPIPNIIFKIVQFTVHPHHWSIFLAILLLLLFLQAKSQIFPELIFYFIISFLLGGITQGFSYKDWYKIIK